jgi:hypothetical protein
MSDPIGRPAGLPGEGDPVYEAWVMLLNGFGYNWYRIDNQLRADDLLIRSRASEQLAAAAARLRDIEMRYRQKYLPPPTRENPFPDPERLAAARRIHAIADRIAVTDTRIRGAAVPPNDQIWARHRNEVDTLLRLGQCDVVLVGAANDLLAIVGTLAPDSDVDAAAEERIDRQLGHFAAALAQRNELLA